eukprot:2042819-Pleurochrysis_carterae.AAC.1
MMMMVVDARGAGGNMPSAARMRTPSRASAHARRPAHGPANEHRHAHSAAVRLDSPTVSRRGAVCHDQHTV